MNDKVISMLKYFAVFCLGFLTNFSGFLENVTSIPNSYKEFKKEYLYDTELLSGTWSNNTEYVLDGADLGLDFEQPKITLSLSVNESGEVNGVILNKKVCDSLPLTWVISMESPEPSLSSLLFDRHFFLKQLKEGKMETVAEFKLVYTDERKEVIEFERVEDRWNVLPKTVKLAKNLPAYDADFNELDNYCAGSQQRLRERVRKLGIEHHR
ncbi:hypothetical protein [Vibrio sp. SCSIO 43137]|uniref:hypothetical protein n=1 Tax=Vibrio sp. SCSIO 43137 TaxID=3021011 RepID=UPI002306F750|nr:hypothetical protein [Vibrio sp. SCSIO 43137]WCE32086.1 hypothetical protein PK654_16395 [Vibrio sp. SCSIO 43137]